MEEATICGVTVATATAGGDAGEDQQRRQQEAAADAEHARQESDRPAHAQEEEHVDGKLGDREVKLHRRRLSDGLSLRRPRNE